MSNEDRRGKAHPLQKTNRETVIALRQQGLSLRQIARKLHISRQRVAQILRPRPAVERVRNLSETIATLHAQGTRISAIADACGCAENTVYYHLMRLKDGQASPPPEMQPSTPETDTLPAAKIVRQWEILRLLFAYPEGVMIGDLAATLHAPLRTVQRDLEGLNEARFNIKKFTRDKKVFYRIPLQEPILPT